MSRNYALVPAAGNGSRFGADLPKQYLPLAGKPLIRHCLETLCVHPRIEKVFVVLSVGDAWWSALEWSDLSGRLETLYCGGASRADSVRNGLRVLHDRLSEDDWVMVHDAARPCLAAHHVDALLDTLAHDDVGGLLAVPLADTLKLEKDGRISRTLAREHLWQAQTPQMFRYRLLRGALDAHREVTDEASAVEAAGFAPRLVASDMSNFKVTYRRDLHLAELILRDRAQESP